MCSEALSERPLRLPAGLRWSLAHASVPLALPLSQPNTLTQTTARTSVHAARLPRTLQAATLHYPISNNKEVVDMSSGYRENQGLHTAGSQYNFHKPDL